MDAMVLRMEKYFFPTHLYHVQNKSVLDYEVLGRLKQQRGNIYSWRFFQANDLLKNREKAFNF